MQIVLPEGKFNIAFTITAVNFYAVSYVRYTVSKYY